jgi:uncharacterized coiled-coil protein SlyX
MPPTPTGFLRVASASVIFALAALSCSAADIPAAQLQELIDQNRRLQEQVRAQQQTIESLNARMADLHQMAERNERGLRDLQDRVETPTATAPAVRTTSRDQTVRVSAEAGLAFFSTGSEGQFPKSEFRADDPVISLEAPVWKNVYLFSELKLLTREANTESFQLGECYADFEDVSAAWGQPGLLNFRAGRLNIPFGEEYLRRSPVTNPLISHSLSDIWGCDEGVEIYGRVGPAQYVFAVQNGGVSRLHDFNADKALSGRVSWQPARWLHLSASAMRTGELAPADFLSEVWFANGFFRSLGTPATTTAFWASLAQADARVHWHNGEVSASLGQARYNDNDRRGSNARRLHYGYLEAVQSLTPQLYGAARYSRVSVPRGYPLTGWGAAGEYFFSPTLTEELRRFSLGLGYRFGPPLVVKVEYSWESGRERNGDQRDQENFFGAELGVKF